LIALFVIFFKYNKYAAVKINYVQELFIKITYGNGKCHFFCSENPYIKLPKDVAQSITTRFPGWTLDKDIYRVNYHISKGVTKDQYQERLENGDKTMKVKIDADGNFM